MLQKALSSQNVQSVDIELQGRVGVTVASTQDHFSKFSEVPADVPLSSEIQGILHEFVQHADPGDTITLPEPLASGERKAVHIASMALGVMYLPVLSFQMSVVLS